MDVQYGTWTDGPNKDVLWTSLGRAMPIGPTGGQDRDLEKEHIEILNTTGLLREILKKLKSLTFRTIKSRE